jgi:hypothetical protein
VTRGGGLLLALATAFVAGCSIDRIEWESSGFVVEEVTRTLRESDHVRRPVVECIKREVGGAVWECRATSERGPFRCEVKVGVRERIHSLACEPKEEQEEKSTAPEG